MKDIGTGRPGNAPREIRVIGVPGLPEIAAGDDLPRLIADAIDRATITVTFGSIFVVAQKIVSKAEGRIVRLSDVVVSSVATAWGTEHGRDPRVLEVVLREARRVVRMDRGLVIAETHHGFICANAGVDVSNVPDGWVTLLPENPDDSADRLRAGLEPLLGGPCGVIVSDTFGRPWREGVTDVALGVAGLQPFIDYRGQVDRHGHVLQVTVVALADEIAAAAEMVMGKAAGVPVAVVTGLAEHLGRGSGAALVRAPDKDLFR